LDGIHACDAMQVNLLMIGCPGGTRSSSFLDKRIKLKIQY
jgi:hypothetical protein